ncbi:DUF6418 domain-containing protein [Planomicrobium sp. CPCC 101110]|uniref:DUF6418 domain-containing protein n=1 Tax=Planomicrobium sp. CPCC 101110 TaxID=2599619 RepID=UPI0011B55981|nr:DUF6418 domain-containing protein [Planomicrobium sp. CPCC 101110]TWT27718.1 oligosaccharide repeat unit polymerase [Planomicrobium sp. CPCC 101110]
MKYQYGFTHMLLFLILEFFYISFDYLNHYIVLIIFLSYIINVFIFNRNFMLRYIYIIFYIGSNIIGIFLIETDYFYLSELRTYSFNNNSFLMIILAHVFFIETLRFLDSKKKESNFIKKSIIQYKNFRIEKSQFLQILIWIFLILFLFMFSRVIDTPFFEVKLDRFLYKDQYLGIWDKISNSILYFSGLIGLYYFHTKDKKVLIFLFMIFTYLFWIGHKFSIFLSLGYIIFLPFIWYVSKKVVNKIIIASIGGILLLIIIVSLQSFIVYERNYSENNEYIKMRLAQQGQLWWATYGVEKGKENNLQEISEEFNTFFRIKTDKNDLYNSGIYKIMKLTTPYDVFVQKVNLKNSRYAYSTQATIYYYFKGLGLILFSIISGIIYFFVINKLIKNIQLYRIIPTILYTRLLLICNNVLLQSDFNKFFSLEVILIITILAVHSIITKNLTKKHVRTSNISKN